MSDGRKVISFSLDAGKASVQALQDIMRDFLSGKAKRSGKKRYGDLVKQGKLENVEISEKNIGSFLNTAKKYDIDFALKKDKSVSPHVYHVFFASSSTENFKRAFNEYAGKVSKKQVKKSPQVNRKQIKENAKIISAKQAAKDSEKSLNLGDKSR